MKEHLYKVIHWVNRAVDGLRADEVPVGSIGSDALVTISMREMEDTESLKKDLEENGAEAVERLFNYHFVVSSLDGKTGEKVSRDDMFQTWLLFTLYMRRVVFPPWEDHPHGKLVELVLKLLAEILGKALMQLVIDNAEKLRDVLGCDDCDKKDECPAGKRNKDDCDRNSDMRYN
jgi:hypothetical protein